MARRFIRIKELATTKGKPGLLPVSPATVWRWVKDGRLPTPIKLGPNTTAFDLDEIEESIDPPAKVIAAYDRSSKGARGG